MVKSGNATTWGNGTQGISGIISNFNSLIDSGSVTGLSNGNYIVSNGFTNNEGLVNAGQVRIAVPGDIFFNYGLGQTMTFNPSTLTNTLASGTNITLQANNDITVNAGADILVGGSNGGAFTLQAGRNINLGSRIVTANGDFTAIAGDPNAVAADRDPGMPSITLGLGASIDAGTGKVTLASIGGNFVNNSGSTSPIHASQWLIYTTDPDLDILNGMTADFEAYGQPYTSNTSGYAGRGNGFLYSNPQKPVTDHPIIQANLIQANFVNLNPVDINFWLSQLVPLQTSTTFLHWYDEKFAHTDDIDTDFGQYKGDDYALKTINYEWRKEHGKKKWSEKKKLNNKKQYTDLLFSIENGGIKLPAGWLLNF